MTTIIKTLADIATDIEAALAERYAHDASTNYLVAIHYPKRGHAWLTASLIAVGEEYIERNPSGNVIAECPLAVKSLYADTIISQSHYGLVHLTVKHLVADYDTKRADWLGTEKESA